MIVCFFDVFAPSCVGHEVFFWAAVATQPSAALAIAARPHTFFIMF
jgi:hypothetical protein